MCIIFCYDLGESCCRIANDKVKNAWFGQHHRHDTSLFGYFAHPWFDRLCCGGSAGGAGDLCGGFILAVMGFKVKLFDRSMENSIDSVIPETLGSEKDVRI